VGTRNVVRDTIEEKKKNSKTLKPSFNLTF